MKVSEAWKCRFSVNVDDLTACQWGEVTERSSHFQKTSGCGEVLTKLSFILSGFLSMNLLSRLPRNATSSGKPSLATLPLEQVAMLWVPILSHFLPGDWSDESPKRCPRGSCHFPETHLSLSAFLKIRTREKPLRVGNFYCKCCLRCSYHHPASVCADRGKTKLEIICWS